MAHLRDYAPWEPSRWEGKARFAITHVTFNTEVIKGNEDGKANHYSNKNSGE